MKRYTPLLLALAALVLIAAAPAQEPEPIEIPFDLSTLIIGNLPLAPIIMLVVAALRTIRVNGNPILQGRTPTLVAVVVLATLGYLLGLLARSDPALEPILVAVLKAGEALLNIFVGAGSAILIHKAKVRLTSSTKPAVIGNPYEDRHPFARG